MNFRSPANCVEKSYISSCCHIYETTIFVFSGKYLLVTNTLSCGVMMGFGDVLQQRGDHWKRHSLAKYFDSENEESRSNDTEISVSLVSANHNLDENNVVLRRHVSLLTDIEEEDTSYAHNFVRTKNMIAVGLVQGPFHHYFYAILDRFLPGRNASSVVKKTFIDQLVASPTCLGIFFFGLGTLEQKKVEDISGEVKLKFFNTYKVRMKELALLIILPLRRSLQSIAEKYSEKEIIDFPSLKE